MPDKIKRSTLSTFQPLEAVLVGQGVSETYFDWVSDTRVRDPLNKIVRETQEDLDNIKRICKEFGADVYQTDPLNYNASLFSNAEALPVPPIQPRDVHLTLDDKVYCTSTETVWN